MVGNRRAARPTRHLVPRAPKELGADHHGLVPKALTVTNGRRPVEEAQVPKEVLLAATRAPRATTTSGPSTTVEQSTNLQVPRVLTATTISG